GATPSASVLATIRRTRPRFSFFRSRAAAGRNSTRYAIGGLLETELRFQPCQRNVRPGLSESGIHSFVVQPVFELAKKRQVFQGNDGRDCLATSPNRHSLTL